MFRKLGGICFLLVLESVVMLVPSFPKTHKIRKIFNRNNVEVSYSCLPNASSIIKPHNEVTLSCKNHPSEPKCNCRKKDTCPLNGNCLAKHVVYSCNVKTSESEDGLYYIGLTENSFKERWYQHNNTFKNQQKANSTELSKHIWSLKENNTTPTLSWEIIDRARPYRNGSKTCSLCLIYIYICVCVCVCVCVLFKEQPLVVFRRAPNLKDNSVRAKLPRSQTEGVTGCFKYGKIRCQVCSLMPEGSSLNVMFQEGNIILTAI